MTLIHAELRSVHDAGDGGWAVKTMVDAVSPVAMAKSAVVLPSESCSLAYQAADGRVATASHPECDVHLVGDLRIDDRAALSVPCPPGAPDVELVLGAYLRRGIAAFERIVGEGAFALWDGRTRQLVCWRDVAGARPLYYAHQPGVRLVVSSDLRSFLAHPGVPPRLDLRYAASMLRFGPDFQHPTRTLIDRVRKLPAANVLVADTASCSVRPYWRPGQVEDRVYPNHTDYIDELRAILQAAIECRTNSCPGEIGAHASGGLDSSSVAVLAQRALHAQGRRLTAFSWAPPDDVVPPHDADERPLARAVARAAGVPLHFARTTPEELLDLSTRDLSTRPTTTLQLELGVSRSAVERGIHTMLSGWGGDELAVYNGKGYLADLARRGRWLTVRRELAQRGEIHDSSFLADFRGRVIRPLLPVEVLERLRPHERRAVPALPECLRPEFASALADVEPLRNSDLRERPGVRRMQIAKLEHGHLQYRMESWASHGIDVGMTYTFPLLDRRVIEFALSIPDHLYFKDGWKRWLYRTAMAGILPDEVRWHPHKQDTSMEMQLQLVRPKMIQAYRDEIEARRDNPFLDFDRYLVADDAGRRTTQSGRPVAPNGFAGWTVFTDLTFT